MRNQSPNDPLLYNVTVIIRSAHERTEELCKKMILDQGIPEPDLFVVHEVPFSEAMRKSFEIGVEHQKKWTFCVDADVLIRPGAIEKMVEYAERQSAKCCEIQGYVMDKFFGGPRQAGNHLYRTSLLPEVIKRIPEEGTDIRPEGYTLKKMREDGFEWNKVPCIVGVHDEGQYYFDIYRKSFVHGVKHTDRAGLFIDLWREKSRDDYDFVVALRGLADSIRSREEAFINRKQKLYHDLFERAGFEEKSRLQVNEISPRKIENMILAWDSPDVYYAYFPTRDGLDTQTTAGWEKVKRNAKNRGVVKTVSLIAGKVLIGLGKRMKSG